MGTSIGQSSGMPFMRTSDIYDVCTALNRHLCRCVSDIQNAVYLEASGGCLSEMTPGDT